MEMRELKIRLSASLNMLKGFCCNGILCNGWREVSDEVIEFRPKGPGRIIRINVSDIVRVDTCRIYDERNGFNKPYPNVVTKEG